MNKLPKLSYILLSHNREKYIRGAVESAFAQDYEGELEYIFCDDCSTDNTYAILQECVANYKGNRHIVLTQTPKNLHLAGNTNHALTFVTSDWIVRADDDDYSRIDRCSIIGNTIREFPDCRYILHGHIRFTDEIDAEIHRQSTLPGTVTQDKISILDSRKGYEVIQGHRSKTISYKVWHMDVYRIFGPLQLDGYYIDDLCSYYRASMLGYGVEISDTDAYFIRDGSNNMSRGGDDNSRGYNAIVRLEKFNDKYFNITLAPLAYDLANYKKYLEKQPAEVQTALSPFITAFERNLESRKANALYWRKGTIYRLSLLRKKKHISLFHIIRCLPLPIFAAIQSVYRKLSTQTNKHA